jgi:hypothetical protein
MTQTTSKFFDEIARLMNDAAGVAQGVKREVDTVFKTQAERWLRDLDLVKREEFDAQGPHRGAGGQAPGFAALPADLCGRPGRHPARGLNHDFSPIPCVLRRFRAISPRDRGPRTPGGMPRFFS